MLLRFSTRLTVVAAALLAVLIFICDKLTPLDVSVWLLYAVPLLVVSWTASRRVTYLFAAVCSLLILIHVLIAPPDLDRQYALVNWALGSALLGIMALLLAQRQETRARLAHHNTLLETRVRERTAELEAACEQRADALAALQESDARYRAIGELIPYGVWACDPDGGAVYVSDSYLEMTGKTLEECRHFGWMDLLPPEDVEHTLADWQACRAAGRLWDYIHRLRGKDGAYRYILSRGCPMRSAGGEITAWVGINLDITQHVLAEQELQRAQAQSRFYARRLVEEIEQERQTIARELHDEAGQALTAILLGLGMLERECQGSAEFLIEPIRELKRTTDEVMVGLHRLSRNLRPASLDRVGLVAALRQHIQAFEQQYPIAVTFYAEDFERAASRLPGDIETTVYRIVQEALTNVARHARAGHVNVIVERRANHVITIVEDDGTGFDPVEAMHGGRLGLLGMRERAELMGGRLDIESEPGQGATVYLDLPAAPEGGQAAEDAEIAMVTTQP